MREHYFPDTISLYGLVDNTTEWGVYRSLLTDGRVTSLPKCVQRGLTKEAAEQEADRRNKRLEQA